MSKKGDQPGLVYMMYDPFFIDFLYYVDMTYFTQFSGFFTPYFMRQPYKIIYYTIVLAYYKIIMLDIDGLT